MDLVFDNVTKLYGAVIGVNRITCRVGPGITCLFGSNGAGKSTLMKLASGQLRPTQGEVRIGPHRAWSTAAKWHFGYSPDVSRFYEEMTGREFVRTMALLYGFTPAEARRRTDELVERVGMTDRCDRPVAGFSHGMRQRIKLAQAMVHDPPILLLDEPFGGIDPGGRSELSRLLMELSESGKTILVSSHLLGEVEDLADSILMLARGRIIASGTLAEVRSLIDDQPFTVQIVARPARSLAGLLMRADEVESVEVRDDTLMVRTRQPMQFFSRLGELVTEHDLDVERFGTLDAGADAVFSYLDPGSG